jgi:hypothetical protein
MGKYIKISFENEEEKKEIIECFKSLYEKHLELEPNQFVNDLGNLQTAEDLLEVDSEFVTIKLGILDNKFFTDAFMADILFEILSK